MPIKKEGIKVLIGPTEKFPHILAIRLALVKFEEVLVARYAAAVLWRAGPLSILHKVGCAPAIRQETNWTRTYE